MDGARKVAGKVENDFVGEFVRRYVREFDFYDHVARLVARMLDDDLRTAGIRCIVTSRAKDVVRLEEKCRRRAIDHGYESVDAIYEDIVDLAGVRIALYFPGDRGEVSGIIERAFRRGTVKIFDGSEETVKGARFSGYWATHHRVHLVDQDLPEPEKRGSSGLRV